MPTDVFEALKAARLRSKYDRRPAYQRNDYIGWIISAKRPETRAKRMSQMIDELKRGDRYMKMAWHGQEIR